MDLKQYFRSVGLENGFVRINSQPHTKDIESLTSCCSGRVTAEYYFVSKYLGFDIDGETVLSEIAKLQDTDKSSQFYGCMRWYREEPRIYDSNGAFFVLKPIALAFLLCPDKISDCEREIILPVLRTAGTWFLNACTDAKYFYPNKIASDGALLLLIGKITQDENLIQKAYEFWDNYMDYTENYGWGWGENTSKCYLEILNAAFEVALCCFDKITKIYERVYKARGILLDYSAYHGEFEFVPSIRTYTFNGTVTATQGSSLSNLSPEKIADKNGAISYDKLMTLILHDHAPKYTLPTEQSAFRVEKIFGNSSATTYKGKNIRLGTVNRFPVMPGCYQNSEWGLGWQSMPVSALATDHELSFLRLTSVSNGKLLTHPAYDKHSAYLNTRLFADENMPDVVTQCNQVNNTAVIVRSVRYLANKASYFADEWYLQHFDGELSEYNEWYTFNYGDCMLAVKPINGSAEIIRNGEKIRLTQKFYEGEEKLLVNRYVTFSWAVVVLDDVNNWQDELDKTEVSYVAIKDFRFPRDDNSPFRITCGEAALDFEPYKNNLI